MPRKAHGNLSEISQLVQFMGKVTQEVRGKSRKNLAQDSGNESSLMLMRRHEPCALNLLRKTGAPGAIPTRDLPLRRRTLYAAELREHKSRP